MKLNEAYESFNGLRAVEAMNVPFVFGKHAGKLVGSLPVDYAFWVCKTIKLNDESTEGWYKCLFACSVLCKALAPDRLEGGRHQMIASFFPNAMQVKDKWAIVDAKVMKALLI